MFSFSGQVSLFVHAVLFAVSLTSCESDAKQRFWMFSCVAQLILQSGKKNGLSTIPRHSLLSAPSLCVTRELLFFSSLSAK